ncbi:MAG: RNase adapter RapZ [Myxococcota bacterium]|nr:RNase adapter RapZ [Myxococcota bacterium]
MSKPKSQTAPLKLTIVTGLSGSGISTAINALEDLGFFCVDSLPPPLVPKLLDLAEAGGRFNQLAIGIDARNVQDVGATQALIDDLDETAATIEIIFLEASDDVLLRRFSVSRRIHPLARYGLPIAEAIRTERMIMYPFRERAQFVLDTSDLNVHECKRHVQSFASGGSSRELFISVMSFGFRYGVPAEADIVWDVRFLPNPHFIEHLRPLTGLDEEIQDYVFKQPETVDFIHHFLNLVDATLPGYENEGKSHLTLAIGCTGGKHRSVSLVERIASHLSLGGRDPKIRHRDVNKENS